MCLGVDVLQVVRYLLVNFGTSLAKADPGWDMAFSWTLVQVEPCEQTVPGEDSFFIWTSGGWLGPCFG